MASQERNGQSISAGKQIRLWGVKAQEKLRSANILLITFKALANEIAKNLVLAGIGSLTILDHEVVTETDLCAQFFVSQEHVGQNRAQAAAPQVRAMNPRVQLHVDTEDVRSKSPEFFKDFDITIATDLDFDTYSTINAACRISNRRFYAAGLHGFYGYAFADLISHDFVIEREKSNVAPHMQETPTRSIVSITTKRENDKVIEMVTKREIYSPLLLANSSPLPEEFTRVARKKRNVSPLLSCLRALWEFQRTSNGKLPSFSRTELETFTRLVNERHLELQLDISTIDSSFLRSFLENLGCELSPVAAFIGGSLAQDVINVLGGREQPLQNLLLFDGEKNVAPIYPLHPIFPPQIEDMAAKISPTATTAVPATSLPILPGTSVPLGNGVPTS
ncbi:SUMO activating enzyme (AosA), putative [Talaromyces stipitatus ATCC 10500]|uniref:Ubiquitin-like 1-activating enzyme E1A n=1 Tax=Talaromyces stipitatus (strain ATCC 10500 / CBS 375.48 / QM 6759 / NRRL 1006) TaxID=441959 RepID=B8MBW1_TALSN|nr:SUMO activating enzyme (AosA), putative [Talaromyces stipitatus ATCC 10500]EED18244.1 SUMO activating enzyme (AosA), putative [Talaromyces stipitatus ATCC 10500]